VIDQYWNNGIVYGIVVGGLGAAKFLSRVDL
jgi:hypothetical protein